MNNLGYFYETTKIKESEHFYQIMNFISRFYDEDSITPEHLKKRLDMLIKNLPRIEGVFDASEANQAIKNLLFLSHSKEDHATVTHQLPGDSMYGLMNICAKEMYGFAPLISKMMYFLVIASYYVGMLDNDKDFSLVIDYSGITDPFKPAVPYVFAEKFNLMDNPNYDYNMLTKGFFVPQGYRLEITHDKGTQTINPGEYSGGQFTIQDILDNKNPDWKLVKVNSPDEQDEDSHQEYRFNLPTLTNPQPQGALDRFAGNVKFNIMDASVGLSDYVHYPEEIVIEEVQTRLRVDSAAQLLSILTGNTPEFNREDMSMSAGIQKDGQLYISLRVNGEKEYEYPLEMERIISEDGKTVTHESLTLYDEFQGKGIGRRIYESQERHWRSIGVETIKLFAGSDVGGYAWAKLDYDFEDPKTYLPNIQVRANKILSAMEKGAYISIEELEKVMDIVENCKTAKQLAELSLPEINPALEGIGKKIMLGSKWPARKLL